MSVVRLSVAIRQHAAVAKFEEMDVIIVCGRCAVRGVACSGCAVTFITEDRASGLPSPASAPVVELDSAETRAFSVLASAGLIPPLRYAPSIAKVC